MKSLVVSDSNFSSSKAQPRTELGIKQCVVHHRTLFIHPKLLYRWNIRFNIIVQRPGDLVLTDNQSLHEGYNVDQNLAVAVNWLSESGFKQVLEKSVKKGADGKDGQVFDPCRNRWVGRKKTKNEPKHAKVWGNECLWWLHDLAKADEIELKEAEERANITSVL